jgi:predicted DNA-binding ribbon-helix-helix protein
MCQIFINADPQLYASRSRSIRLQGVATSLRLENLFWQVLEEIGQRDGLSVPQLVGRLYEELMHSGRLDETTNFSSFLRVSCLRYLQLQLDGRIPADTAIPLRALDPVWVLATRRPAHSHERNESLA